MKSYGRAPTFLALTGYEQVRSVAAALAGDHEAASRVELTLPETGVCGGAGLFDDAAAQGSGEAGGGCCGPTPTPAVDQRSLPVAMVPTARTASQLIQIGVSAGGAGACGPSGC